MKRLLIDLPNLPEDGNYFSGELAETIFELSPPAPRPVSPLTFDLRAQRFDSELLLTGTLSAAFEFTCVRTLHPFIQTIEVDPAAIAIEITEECEIDVSEELREEILLNFPAHPRCDNADEPQHCKIDSRYLAVDKPTKDAVETPPHPEGGDQWSALDGIQKHDTES